MITKKQNGWLNNFLLSKNAPMLNSPSNQQEQINTLSKWLRLQTAISKEDFEYIKNIIAQTELSSYLLEKDDFMIIKDEKQNIVSFWRLYPIEKWCKEISSLRVDPTYRGKRIWLYLCKELIEKKKGNSQLFLATKTSLEVYYKELWFQTITDWIPEKLIHTGIRAKEHGIEFVIMKYVK